MSKNLEKEYREFTIQNAPDLWERIQSGLEAKELAAEKRVTEVKAPAAEKSSWEPKESSAVIKCSFKGKKSATAAGRRLGKYRMWGVAAACLCLVVTGFSLRNQFMPEQGALTEEFDGMAMNGGAEGPQTAVNEGVDYEAAGMEVRQEDDAMMAAEREAADSFMDSEGNGIFEAPREDWAAEGGVPGDGILEEIALQIEIAYVINEEEQVVYAVEIRTSADPSLQAGDRITLYEGRNGAQALREGEIYDIYAFDVTEPGGEKTYRLIGIK